MRKFMDKDFLLMNDTAKELFFNHAKDMPIFDYHCHLIPSQIAEDKRFTTITEAWLGGDHYKWRAMRSNGVNEELITGNADPFDKFMAWAGTMENLIGNPLYHWTHLELQRYFGIYDVLNRKNARKIYDEANEKFADDPELSVFGIMKKFNVYAVGTTDDPADDLAMHQKIIAEGKCPAKVIPSFRPDKAIHIEKDDFVEYLPKLAAAAGVEIKSVDDVVEALVKRLEMQGDRPRAGLLPAHLLDEGRGRQGPAEEAVRQPADGRGGGCLHHLRALRHGQGVQETGHRHAAALRVHPRQQHHDVPQARPRHRLRRLL